MNKLLVNCTVIDGTGGAPIRNASIAIRDGRIVDIGPMRSRVDGDDLEKIDLEEGFVLPGFCTMHVHLGDVWPNPDPPGESVAERAIRSGRNAMDALRQGVTTMRVVGEVDFIDVAWRRAFVRRIFIGPNVYASGNALIATGGHAHTMEHTVEVDGPHALRREVRHQIKNGVDWIKLYTTGAEVLCERGLAGELQYTLEEIQAATEAAHDKGCHVCSHTGSSQGVKRAILGGIDCIEHGYSLDDSAIGMMVQHNVFYTPTLNVTHNSEYFRRVKMSEEQSRKAQAAAPRHADSFRRAHRAGVRITCGGDNNPIGYGTLAEIELLVHAGMSEMEALVAATRTGAECCRAESDIGTITVGKRADLVVLGADPLADIKNIHKTRAVFKDGISVSIEPTEGTRDFWDLFY